MLCIEEIDAVTAWVRWLASVQPDAVHANRYQRVLDTLTLLRLMAEDKEASA